MRRICYVSGTRADFGLLKSALLQAQRTPGLAVSVCVTGAHLAPQYGETVREIEASGLPICGRVPVALDGGSGAGMAKAIAATLAGMVDVFERERPDLVLLLGDRGEMLAGALAAIHLNIPVVHIHGGERSGTVDEPVRHAISKLSHYHLVATVDARQRLVRMGELPQRVFVTGAPGLDDLVQAPRVERAELCRGLGFDPKRPVAIVMFHPVLQESAVAGEQMEQLLAALAKCAVQALVFMPNSDAGAREIANAIDKRAQEKDIRVVTHLERPAFISWMAAADVMVGNSSSGIIEAASLGLPVVNVGERQRYRERSANTVDVPARARDIAAAIDAAVKAGRGRWANVYGDGKAGQRIVEHLANISLDPEILRKANAY